MARISKSLEAVWYFSLKRFRAEISTRHGRHQLAQKLTTTFF